MGNEMDESRVETEFHVVFILQPDGFRHRIVATANTTLKQIKEQVISELKLTSNTLSIPELDDACAANGIHPADFTLANAGLILNSDQEIILNATVAARKIGSSEYVMPSEIDVTVATDQGAPLKTFTVHILKFTGHKPYLGGYRHKITDQVFHHATAQTVVTKQKIRRGPARFHRETQTHKTVTKSAQTVREHGTQMTRSDLLVDERGDRQIVPNAYFDSAQLDCLRMDACLRLQCQWRAYRARCFVHAIRQKKLEAYSKDEQFAVETKAMLANKQRQEIDRRMHPKSQHDFEVLYNELDQWRLYETKKVQEQTNLDEKERTAALAAILAKETKLLQTIDRLKATATSKNRSARIEAMLDVLSRPKQWQMSDGIIKPVDTPYTVRAKELSELYHGLKLPLQSVEERLEVLLHVKWTVKEFECPLTQELMELIDREADMLNRGRPVQSVEGLRKRIANLFLQFIENPTFNPEAARLRSVIGNS
ncbi:hypothetical protein LEN26_016872 [Aphanomyces euteiches]|nr:hypothetical protein LEN26_016872 [Aphanomyces euteiches]KAH9113542.1 hypothetical protein AeMF1_012277 [Aphanomyces euteiches]KAH9186737.1 hypothetical protein AeNC1_011287 [Aphanomyces euteiches]